MEYYNEPTRHLDDKELKFSEQLTTCKKVKAMAETKGWEEVMGPYINGMIGGIMGQRKSNGVWAKGKVHGARTDERREYYIGYMNACMDILNSVQNYINNIEVKEKAIERLEVQRQKGTKVPMVDGGSYAA